MKATPRQVAQRWLTATCIGTGLLYLPSAACTEGACVSAPLQRLALGFTITHRQAGCPATGPQVPGTRPSDNILLHYDSADTRKAAQAVLGRMRGQGARVARVVLWYRHAEDPGTAGLPDHLGLALASAGRLPARVVGNIVHFVGDVAAAGYERLYVVPGPQGRGLPSCRRKDWGDCFDKRITPLSWGVTQQLVTVLRASAPASLDLIVDLAVENCFVPGSRRPQDAALRRHAEYMLRRYREAFGDDRFVTSCLAVSPPRTAASLQGMRELYRQLGMTPAAVDVHLYQSDRSKVEALLDISSGAAKALEVPLDIGETYADDQMIFGAVAGLVEANRLPNLRSLLIWPRRVVSVCSIGLAPPFDFTQVEIGLRRRSPGGAQYPVCR